MLDTANMEDVPLADSKEEADDDWDFVDPRFDAPQTPSTTSDEAPAQGRNLSDGDSDEDSDAHAHGELVPRRKPGGYDSRVEQMLYENPELPILITDAGKSSESGGRYIVYTIKTGVRFKHTELVRRDSTDKACGSRSSLCADGTRSSLPSERR
jgi:hypothetical protein